MDLIVLAFTAVAVLVLMLTVWAFSVRLVDASIVDIGWGFGFVVIAWVARSISDGGGNALSWALVACTTVWGLRLAAFLAKRNIGKGEDPRYQAMRRRHGERFPIISLRTVFLTQGVLMWVVSLPVQLAIAARLPEGDRDRLGPVVWIGMAVWLVGVLFEACGDLQLARFKSDPGNAGKVMDRGLWAWTRHPNYFGDFCVWWGLYVMSLGVVGEHPVVLVGAVGPALMSFLLMRVSGVPMLERSIGKRRPGYDEYVRRTSAFFPRPPRRS